MTFPATYYIDQLHHPIVDEARTKAHNIIDQWLRCGLSHGEDIKANAVSAVMGWDGAYLAETIAIELMRAQGFDVDALFEGIDCPPPGWTPKDVCADLDGYIRWAEGEDEQAVRGIR